MEQKIKGRPKTKEKKIKEVPWERVTEKDLGVIQEFSHFNPKIANTKNTPFGIRLSSDDRIDLPYVALRTMDIREIPLDYLGGASDSPSMKKYLWVKNGGEGNAEVYTNVVEQDLDLVRATLPSLDSRYETKSEFVGLRLRQIVVQSENNEDIVLTPLPSPGFSEIIKKRLDKEALDYSRKNERHVVDHGDPDSPEMIGRWRGFLGIGGSNMQNVGQYVSSAQTVLFFCPPTEDREKRTAYAIHFRGVDRSIPRPILRELYEWRSQILASHRGIMPGDAETRETERVFLLRIVEAIKKKASESASLIDKHEDSLPEREQEPDPWLDPSLRTMDWVKDQAKEVWKKILDARFFYGKTIRSLDIGEHDALRWIGIIEEGLL